MGPRPSKNASGKSKAKPPPAQERQPAHGTGKGRTASTASSGTAGAGRKAGRQLDAAAATEESTSASESDDEDVELTDIALKSIGTGRKAANTLHPSKQAVRESNGAQDSEKEDGGASDDSIEEASSEDDLASLREKLARTVALARKLKKKKAATPSNPTGKCLDRVPGSGTSIQMAMGLLGGPESKEYHTYKAVQRNVKTLCIRGQFPWHKTWDKVPPEDKAKLCRAAREQAPFLARYRDDWATLDLAQQWCKNQRNRAYADGTLERPEKYAYLKANAAQRKGSGSRRKRAFIEAELAAEAAGAEQKKRKKRKISTSAGGSAGGHGAEEEALTSAARKSIRKKGKGKQSGADISPHGADSGDVDDM
ncbi:hypothetical protein FB107DRAFT_247586 [Schizophyllum commune]